MEPPNPVNEPEHIEITTSRLLLRELEEEDWRTIAAYTVSPEVQRYMLAGQGTQEAAQVLVRDARLHAKRHLRHYFALGIVLKSEGALIGTCVLSGGLVGGMARIGWDLNQRYWNQGIMTEAAGALLDFAFEQIQVECVFADCFLANRACIRVMEKLGMQHQRLSLWSEWGLMRDYKERRRLVRYYLYDEEWKQFKEQRQA